MLKVYFLSILDDGLHLLFHILLLAVKRSHLPVNLIKLTGTLDLNLLHNWNNLTVTSIYLTYSLGVSFIFSTIFPQLPVSIIFNIVLLLDQVCCPVGKFSQPNFINHLITVCLRICGKRLIPLRHGRIIAHSLPIFAIHLLHQGLLLFLAALEVFELGYIQRHLTTYG